MAKVTVKIYDEKGNVVDELPYGTNGITGTNGTGQPQEVYSEVDESGNTTYFSPGYRSTATDPFENVGQSIEEYASVQAPQIKIVDGQVTLNAPQKVLDSPLAQQVREELQSLKGANLESQDVKEAIDALNEEIRNTVKNSTIQGTLGWTTKAYTDYQRLLQTLRQANPMSSGEYFIAKRPGADFYYEDDGETLMSKTPQEWIDYWREIYNTDQRTQMYKKSLESDDPYERVMGLIMSGGNPTDADMGYPKVIYGYDLGEYLGKFWETAKDNLKLAPMGIARSFMSSEDTDRLQSMITASNLDIDDAVRSLESVKYDSDANEMTLPWTESEEAFNEKWEEVKGKKDKELSAAERLFTLEVASAKQSSYPKKSLYERVKQLDQDFWKLWAYDKDVEKMEQKHIDDSLWASGNVTAGNIVGTIGRFVWENAIGKALTGYSMNRISDVIAGSAEAGTGILGWLANHGISPTSAVGSGTLRFGAQLIGTIPEDIVQTAVDNVVTYNTEQNQYLLDPAQMGENFRNNLLFMAAANAVLAGVSGIQRVKYINDFVKKMDLDQELDFDGAKAQDIMEAADEAARAVARGGSIEVRDGKVYVIDTDGNASVLENMTAEQAQLLNNRIQELEEEGFSEAQKMKAGASSDIADIKLETRTVESLTAERDAEIAKLEQLEARRQKWVENDYKDENGVDVRQREQTDYSLEEIYGTSKLDILDGEIDIAKKNIAELDQEIESIKESTGPGSAKARYEESVEKIKNSADNIEVDETAKITDGSEEVTTKVETGSSDEGTGVSADDYATISKNIDNIVNPEIKIDATPSNLYRAHNRDLNAIMRSAQSNLFSEFRARFGDVDQDDFDWVFQNTKQGLTPDQIIGTQNPKNFKVVDQNMIDAMKWWGNHPANKILRELSRQSLGLDGDMNLLGYLPHTSYDPSVLSIEEAKPGQLWQHYTGKSVMNDGEFIGYGGTLESRYRTFASNMLWDIRNKEVMAAKLIEEAELEGKKLSSDDAMKMVDQIRKLDSEVDNAKSSQSMVKGAMKNGSEGADDFRKAAEEVEKEAPLSGAGKATHDAWGDCYMGANSQRVEAQPKSFTVALDTQGNTMRKIVTGDGNMYRNGGASLVYAPQDAFMVVARVQNENVSWEDAVSQFLVERSGRSKKYADMVTERIMARLARDVQKNGGELTKGLAIQSLTKAFRSEAWSRYRRWLARAKFDEFNESTRKFIDDFTFRHMQMDSFTNNQGIITKLTNSLLELRYDSLFYGNLKNALLQVSELNRLFTSFEFKDVTGMLKRLATDADFRAEVDMYVEAVAPKTPYIKAALYEDYGKASGAMEIDDDGVRFKKFKDGKETLNNIMLAPIEKAEALKNRTMVAALVSEADRLEANGILKNGSEKLMRIRQRFERVALAQNEMGRIGLASNPVAKPFLFLQNFQIRELGMHLYNIFDPEDLDTGGKLSKGATWNAAKYAMKVLGTKLGTTLILARLGYDASQTMGLDPFGIANNYSRLSEEEKTDVDKQLTNGFMTPFVSGGIMSLFADMYFMARKSYEDAHRETVADDAEARLNEDENPLNRMDWSALFDLDNWLNVGKGFIPGYTAFNRAEQMNEMLSSGWATSATGNKMYTAPDDALNTILGYLFGRSATQNAVNYNQTYGNNLGQTLSRTVGQFLADIGEKFGGEGYSGFDPIDSKNYTDWFDGSENDTQQFEKGRRYFNNRKKTIIKAYTDALNEGFGTEEEDAEAKADMNRKLDNLFEDMARFVDAYEKKHGTITGKMVKQLLNVLNTEFKSPTDTTEEEKEGGFSESDKALERYVQLGLPNVGTYTGPSKKYPNTQAKYQGSPQWRLKSGTRYDLQNEAAAVLRAGDAVLQDLRKDIKEIANQAYQTGDYTEFNKAQKQYLEAFDNVVGPIIAMYGNGVLSSKVVKDQLEEMLATSTNTGKVNLIPSEQYAKDKWGRYRSMPNESVDVGKWAQQRYSSDIFKRPTVKSYSTTQEDLDAIKRLISNGQKDMARARALELKVRIDNQKRSINKSDYQWLLNFLNNGGTQ